MKEDLCNGLFFIQCKLIKGITGNEPFKNNMNNNNNYNLKKNEKLTKFIMKVIVVSMIIGTIITFVSLYLAIKCNKFNSMLIIHILLAFWFPPIYLLYILIKGC